MNHMNHRRPPRQPADCARFADLAPLLDSDELTTTNEQWARAHLATCANCQRVYAGYALSADALRRHYRAILSPTASTIPTGSLLSATDIMRSTDMDDLRKEPLAPPNAPTQPNSLPPSPRQRWSRGPIAVAATILLALAVVSTLLGLHAFAQRGSSAHATPTPNLLPTPVKASFGEVPLGANLTSPTAMKMTVNGTIWLLDPQTNTIARRTPNGEFTYFPAPSANAGLTSLTIATDGAVWFTESNVRKIGRIDRYDHITEYTSAFPNNTPKAITWGSGGSVWVVEQHIVNGAIESDDFYQMASNGVVKQTQIGATYGLGNQTSDVVAMTTTPEGQVWFSENATSFIAVFDPTEPLPYMPGESYPFVMGGVGIGQGTSADAVAIADSADNTVWVAAKNSNSLVHLAFYPGTLESNGYQGASAGKLGADQVYTGNSGLAGIAVAPNGAVWFTEANTNQIGRIGLNGILSEYPVPTAHAGLHDIAVASDGTVWFTEDNSGKLGYILPWA